jgi:tetratricopeptide (TPR) repeat protein
MSGTYGQRLDPAALLVILVVAGVGVAVGLLVLRRRARVLLWMKSARAGLDVIRRDPDRMAEYSGGLGESEAAVSQPFELGRAAMTACDWYQAIDHFHQAQAKANRAQLVPLLNQTGACYYIQGRLGHALGEFRESDRLAEYQGDRQGRASALNNIGVIRHEYGELDGALEQFRKALAMARESGDQRLVATCLGNAGNIQREKGEFGSALKSQRDALTISLRIGDKPGVACALGNVASVRRDKGELGKALKFYAKAVESARETGDSFRLAVLLGSIGGVQHDLGDLNQALMSHEEALAGARRIGDRLGVAAELGNVGFILADKELHAQAVPTLAESLAILLAIGAASGPGQVLHGLSKCDDRLGRDRMPELLMQAGLAEASIADLLDRVDQTRLKRPWQRSGRPVPFVLRPRVAGASS